MQNLHIAEAHTALDIFRFAVFFFYESSFIEGGVYLVLWATIHTYVKLNNSRLCI